MHHNTKVATCCYCGLRAALVLDAARHELVCRSCGAPLHELKMLPLRAPSDKAKKPKKTEPKREVPEDVWATPLRELRAKPVQNRPRKSKIRWLLSEAVDLIEDVFD